MISEFFINRPIFAAVLSIVITISGAIAVFQLPVSQYPNITPPTIVVSARYPGANAEVVRDTIASAIEEQVNGVEGMIYMSSVCTNDGAYTLTITFELETDVTIDQVLVQNRVSLALPTIPSIVQQQGITVTKKSPNTLMIINLVSQRDPETDQMLRDNLYLSNYASLQIKDELARLDGVGDVTFMGQRDYSMRVWLDPQRLASLGLTAAEVVQAIEDQNAQITAGQIGAEPAPAGQQLELAITTLGRLTTVDEFSDIVIKSDLRGGLTGDGARGNTSTGAARSATAAANANARIAKNTGIGVNPAASIVRLSDVARVELGSQQYSQACTLDGEPSVALSVFQLPGSNAIATARSVYAKMDELSRRFPPGVEYQIVYDTTPFIHESITEVFKTLRDAMVLVGLVVLVFLQNWRATLIPLIAVPVAIVGAFAVMAVLGFSLNNLSLFGLVLAIGVVVDDAIVVVENVQRWLEQGETPHAAAVKAMQEVTGPVVAVALVLSAVFLPCAFIAGITGEFFRQFGVTIAVSTIISAFNSLTLSPALAALLLQPVGAKPDILTRLLNGLFGWFFKLFNLAFDQSNRAYTAATGILLRVCVVVLVIYGGLLYLTYDTLDHAPSGFVPQQDKGYLLLNVQLPDAASLQRTEAVTSAVEQIARGTPGVAHTVGISGQSILLNANASNLGSLYVMLEPFHQRSSRDLTADAIAARIRSACRQQVSQAQTAVFAPPPVDGLGVIGGFTLVVEDRDDQGLLALEHAADALVERGNSTDGLSGLFTGLRADTPWIYLDVARDKCESLGVSVADVFSALQYNIGSYYVNDFNEFGRSWQVNVMAESDYRSRVSDIRLIQVKNRQGDMVPLSTLLSVKRVSGPVMLQRFNSYPAAIVYGDFAPGTSSGQGVEAMRRIAREQLPKQMAFQWADMIYMQLQAGNTAMYVFALAVVFVFLVLAALYESWLLPLAVILVVPMCLLSSVAGVLYLGLDVNIFTQIGFVVLVGLACKNAILIVEFARQRQAQGASRRQATLDACRLRLRPVLMTSFAFILGVVPLVMATGAGAEMRYMLGAAVFFGMLGVTLFGVILTPVFYYAIMAVTDRQQQDASARQ
ncbi:Efflux pump membrane transporter BepE [Posidoniimonas corsicana]|uniref:Efflux pump membrane transporter BepE n=1 Tax=Posidoniimonas corsicana TaxID=1938618 RepID=A0A5C5UUN7_9BACT|nr:efflux RND transporter permease subunit [Posidoniimonas corsicana]TWT29323.1 Efflux pump membrane transporter BepE [Posidoniimonas corsicana]